MVSSVCGPHGALSSCRNNQPEVKTAVPVDHRFEHISFSRTTVNDHSIVNMEQKATAAVDVSACNLDLDSKVMKLFHVSFFSWICCLQRLGACHPFGCKNYLAHDAWSAFALFSFSHRQAMVERAETGEMLPPSEQTMQRLGTMRRRAEEVVESLEKCKSLGVCNPKDPSEVQDEVKSLSMRMEGALKSDSFFSRLDDDDEAVVDETGGYENRGGRASDDGAATAEEARSHGNGGERQLKAKHMGRRQRRELQSPAQSHPTSASAAPTARRWQDAAQRVSQTKESKKWTRIMEALLEESEDDCPRRRLTRRSTCLVSPALLPPGHLKSAMTLVSM